MFETQGMVTDRGIYVEAFKKFFETPEDCSVVPGLCVRVVICKGCLKVKV